MTSQITGLLGIAALAAAIFVLRGTLRNDPAVRKMFVRQGSWMAVSRRFGAPYVVAAFLAPFIWVVVAPNFIPDTKIGAWLVFGPALVCIMVGVCLGALCVGRWLGDER